MLHIAVVCCFVCAVLGLLFCEKGAKRGAINCVQNHLPAKERVEPLPPWSLGSALSGSFLLSVIHFCLHCFTTFFVFILFSRVPMGVMDEGWTPFALALLFFFVKRGQGRARGSRGVHIRKIIVKAEYISTD